MCRLLLLSSSKFSDVRNSPLSIYVCRFQEKNDVKALRRTPNAVVFEQAPFTLVIITHPPLTLPHPHYDLLPLCYVKSFFKVA